MPTYINNLCSAPYSLTGASGYKPLLTLEDIAAAIQELTDLQSQLSCCVQTEKDAEAIVFTATPSGTAPNYDWSCEIRLNTCFFAGDVLTVDLTGIPNNFTLDSISPITPATVLINVVAKTLVFTGTVLAGTYFVISGTFDDNVCVAGTATLTLSGDTIITNNVVTGAYSGATWCVPPVPPTTGLQKVNNATMGAPNNSDSGCAGGFISETVTITGGGLNIPITTFPANLCALLDNLAVTSGTTELTITSTVVTACGTASDTLILPIVEVGGLITTIDGVDCSPVPPTTVVNPPIGLMLDSPTNNANGCASGLTSKLVEIRDDNANLYADLTNATFPIDLCTVLSGLAIAPTQTTLNIISTVTTACGADTDTYVLSIDQAAGVITGVNGVSCLPPPLKDTLVDTDNNANGFGCNAGNLVYPFSIDLTARGGTKVAVTSDADIIAAYAALPIPITVTISGCDILLPIGETPTDIEVECLYDCYNIDKGKLLLYPLVENRFNAGDVISFENIGYDAFGSNVVFSYTLSAAEANTINTTAAGIIVTAISSTAIANTLAALPNSINVTYAELLISRLRITNVLYKLSIVHNPANTVIRAQMLINGVAPIDATKVTTSWVKAGSTELTPCV